MWLRKQNICTSKAFSNNSVFKQLFAQVTRYDDRHLPLYLTGNALTWVKTSLTLINKGSLRWTSSIMLQKKKKKKIKRYSNNNLAYIMYSGMYSRTKSFQLLRIIATTIIQLPWIVKGSQRSIFPIGHTLNSYVTI